MANEWLRNRCARHHDDDDNFHVFYHQERSELQSAYDRLESVVLKYLRSARAALDDHQTAVPIFAV